MYRNLFFVPGVIGVIATVPIILHPATATTFTHSGPELSELPLLDEAPARTSTLASVDMPELVTLVESNLTGFDHTAPAATSLVGSHDVPFYSQFTDITSAQWQKVGCGIASVAMLIDFYAQQEMDVDALLQRGIQANAFLDDAGWTHNGLINLTKQYGLDGDSHSLAHLSMQAAFMQLEHVVKEGPVMVSVHYTFQPTNPIPHLAVVTGITGDRVYYNDPADQAGGNSISIDQFQRAWKKRYIEIRPIG